MLAIRMQRTGRKGHAQFRIVAQDSRRTPTSGAIVARLGHYNPHSKEVVVDKEKIAYYLEHGAQPSDRVARLLKAEGVKLPSWVKLAADKARVTRNTEKLRKNQPKQAEPTPTESAADVVATEEPVSVSDSADEAAVTMEEMTTDAPESAASAKKTAAVPSEEEAPVEPTEPAAE